MAMVHVAIGSEGDTYGAGLASDAESFWASGGLRDALCGLGFYEVVHVLGTVEGGPGFGKLLAGGEIVHN